MIHAYAETYLNDAMSNLGEAFDYAVNACGLSPDKFMELFIASGFADKFGKGNPKNCVFCLPLRSPFTIFVTLFR